MRNIKQTEIQTISAGANPRILNVAGGALFGGIVEGVAGFSVAGPPGFVAGFLHGLMDGAGSAMIYEAGTGLADMHR